MATELPARAELPRLTDRMALGASGLQASPFCLGMVRSPDVVCEAFDAGINFFFVTTDMHWPLYEPLRRGLAKLLARSPAIRDQIVVAAVSYVTQPEFTLFPFEETCACVPGLGRIDMVVLGGVYGGDFEKRLPIFQLHRKRHFVGASAIGATFHERRLAIPAVNDALVDVAFIRYNPLHPGAREDVLPHLSAGRKTRLFNFKSTVGSVISDEAFAALGLPEEVWRPSVADHYRFALTHASIDGVLCSLNSTQEVAELSGALALGPLTAEEQEHCEELAIRLENAALTDVPTAKPGS